MIAAASIGLRDAVARDVKLIDLHAGAAGAGA
jgi:hypothetical protein